MFEKNLRNQCANEDLRKAVDGFHLFCIGERSEAVNCERSEQEGEEP